MNPDSSEDSEKKEILFQNEILDKNLKNQFVGYYLQKNNAG